MIESQISVKLKSRARFYICILKSGPVGSTRLSRSASNCVASPECSVYSSQSFSFLPCSSPIVISISPNQGTYHDPIIIQGFGFSSITCAIEVKIQGEYRLKKNMDTLKN